jgi:hypothetical protein
MSSGIGLVLGGLLGAGAAYVGYKLLAAPPPRAPSAPVPQAPIGANKAAAPNPLAYFAPKQAGFAPVAPPTPPSLLQSRTATPQPDPWAGIATAGFAALPGLVTGVNSIVVQQQQLSLAQEKQDAEIRMKQQQLDAQLYQSWGSTTADGLSSNPDTVNPVARPADLNVSNPSNDPSPAYDGYPYQEVWNFDGLAQDPSLAPTGPAPYSDFTGVEEG